VGRCQDGSVDPHQKSYVCTHVFAGELPVLYVTRPDGDWCFLCGDEHPKDDGSLMVVGAGHVLDNDPTLDAILDLQPNEEADRRELGGPWERQAF